MTIDRRTIVKHLGAAGAALPAVGALGLAGAGGEGGETCRIAARPSGDRVSLEGLWLFRLDPGAQGEASGWSAPGASSAGWRVVTVPHTWNVEDANVDFAGVAWYRRDIDVPAEWKDLWVRVEFEAVFHSAWVWLNGEPVGEHVGKGYTAFTLDLSPRLEPGRANTLVVRVDNRFDDRMIPRGRSYDWARDGGIVRPVSLLVTPRVFVERVEVDAEPDLVGKARVAGRAFLRNAATSAHSSHVVFQIVEEESGRVVLSDRGALVNLEPGGQREAPLPTRIVEDPRLWDFDHPHLYRLVVEASAAGSVHRHETTFGIRKIEIRDGAFHLNGERVRLMGVERMPLSDPEHGAAEPGWLSARDHADMKALNCIFTRHHMPQDRCVLEWCDRNGILVQVEVPAWGPETFEGMTEPDPGLLRNGLEQLREMVRRDRNHPCVFAWGLCNEVNGKRPAARRFIETLRDEARRLDPKRLLTYASDTLREDPGQDAAGLLDFISWNEYFETWHGGTAESVGPALDRIVAAFPGKPIVVSEYGYCECDPKHAGGDEARVHVLEAHTATFRKSSAVGGVIFFCYNDYRTHMGDKGFGVLKQRVHGVVDVYGSRKPSYEALRREASPVESLAVRRSPGGVAVTVRCRSTVPAHDLDGYRIRAVVHGFGGLPMEKRDVALPKLAPGESAEVELPVEEAAPSRIVVDVLRPTGFSALTAEWRP
jgi:beta-glucuronidase